MQLDKINEQGIVLILSFLISLLEANVFKSAFSTDHERG